MPAPYDPFRHHRRSLRLPDWDYTAGFYFITICTSQRQNLFDNPTLRDIAANAWQNIPAQPHAAHVTLDEWVVMPNHLHALVILVGPGSDVKATFQHVPAGSLAIIVNNYKSLVTRRINNIQRTPGHPVWQRGYYERNVRNDRELTATRQYILDNPQRWADDRDNLDALLSKMTPR